MLLYNMLEAFAGPEPTTYYSSKHGLLQFHWTLYQMVIFADVNTEVQRIKCLDKGQAGEKEGP